MDHKLNKQKYLELILERKQKKSLQDWDEAKKKN